MMSSLARRARSRDGGFTLVEMLVSITLLSIVLSLATGILIKVMRQNSNLMQQTEAQTRNNLGMEQATRALRQAVLPTNGTSKNSTVITIAQGNQIQFTTRLAGTSTANQAAFDTPVQALIKFDTTTHTLVWGIGTQNACTAPAVCTYATPTINRTLVRGVRNDGGSTVCSGNTFTDGAVFHYWYVDATGNLAAWSSTSNTLADISVVQIDLWTQTQTGAQTPKCVGLTDYVQLRNWK